MYNCIAYRQTRVHGLNLLDGIIRLEEYTNHRFVEGRSVIVIAARGVTIIYHTPPADVTPSMIDTWRSVLRIFIEKSRERGWCILLAAAR